MKNDQFAEIAAGYQPAQDRGLKPILPPDLPDRSFLLESGSSAAFDTPAKMSTPEDLQKALAEARKQYAPFLQNLAPECDTLVSRTELTEFSYRLDNDYPPTLITIPQYNGPIGKHVAVYQTSFLSEHPGKRVYICFQAVDYIADVYVNEAFVGRHEGMFSPFEFDATDFTHYGENALKVVVHNDWVMMANANVGDELTGDKVYAATGPGWDGAMDGWHHCPPGFGIYGRVHVEHRSPQNIFDLFPRFNSNASEIWIECKNGEENFKHVSFGISIYGRNFEETQAEDLIITPTTRIATGIGDTLTEAQFIASGILGKGTPLLLGYGYNRFVLPVKLDNPRIWSPDTPWLYEAQVTMYIDDEPVSRMTRQFGVRDFVQEMDSEPKGRFLLNGKEIRLRGANTMGYEQQDVMRGDIDQLIDDMLLAKLCNMNFLRLTQRPVQSEIYDICDRLGLMIQTDMPLFGTIRINQYCETLRQTEEMEKLIRSHPSCIIVSYINEPFPNSANQPHRMITREAMMKYFAAADDIVHLMNPDRVIKHVDGDYDPPSLRMPDNHCYTMWYNGHGLDAGKLHKGWWLDVMPGWYCGCGEFGAEGLDPVSTMLSDYPKDWLKEPFDPCNVFRAQTGPFHYFFYETPKSMEEWVTESHRHQAFAAKLMTSAFRRNAMINTFAIHLFIDAWPSGWMKSIMDCHRNPKEAYFTYRDCLSPVYCSLRSDRNSYFGGETGCVEAWLASDNGPMDTVAYMVEMNGKVISSGEYAANSELFQGFVKFDIPAVSARTSLRLVMCAKKDGKILHWNDETYAVWPAEALKAPESITYAQYAADKAHYDKLASEGGIVFLQPMDPGTYMIGDETVTVTACGMSSLYFASRDTGHRFVDGLAANDIAYLYDNKVDRMTPVLDATFECANVTPAVISGNQDEHGSWHTVCAMGEIPVGKGAIVVNQLLLDGKEKNPAVVRLLNNMAKG